MSEREWKPGDLAIATIYSGEFVVFHAIDGWVNAFASRARDMATIDSLRPLVAIDPEDREAVERLYRLYVKHSPAVDNGYTPELQAALREYANPKPPRPDEPQGLGAVVEDEGARAWVRGDHDVIGWTNGGEWRRWDEINAVRVLSPGVEVDQ